MFLVPGNLMTLSCGLSHALNLCSFVRNRQCAKDGRRKACPAGAPSQQMPPVSGPAPSPSSEATSHFKASKYQGWRTFPPFLFFMNYRAESFRGDEMVPIVPSL